MSSLHRGDVVYTHIFELSEIKAGDDEGSIELKVSKAGVHVLAVNLLISGTHASFYIEALF